MHRNSFPNFFWWLSSSTAAKWTSHPVILIGHWLSCIFYVGSAMKELTYQMQFILSWQSQECPLHTKSLLGHALIESITFSQCQNTSLDSTPDSDGLCSFPVSHGSSSLCPSRLPLEPRGDCLEFNIGVITCVIGSCRWDTDRKNRKLWSPMNQWLKWSRVV